MYLRAIKVLIGLTAIAIAVALFRPRPPTPLAASVIMQPVGDAGLSRRLKHVTFDHVPLKSAVESIRRMAGINLAIEWENQADSSPDLPITLNLHDVSVEQVLRVFFNGQDIGVCDGQVVVVTSSGIGSMRSHLHDIQDLVSPPVTAVVAEKPTPGGRSFSSKLGELDGVHPSPKGFGLPPLADEQELIGLLNRALGSSEYYSGVSRSTAPGVILVYCTLAENHRFTDALWQLRHPISVGIAPLPTPIETGVPRLKLVGVTVEAAIDRLAAITGVNLCIRRRSGRIEPFESVIADADLRDVTLEEALSEILKAMRPWGSASATEIGNVVVIGMDQEHDDHSLARVYDVREILAQPPDEAAGDELPAPGDSAGREKLAERQLRRRVREILHRQGDRSSIVAENEAYIRTWHGRLIVRTTRDRQRDVWNLLHDLVQKDQFSAPISR